MRSFNANGHRPRHTCRCQRLRHDTHKDTRGFRTRTYCGILLCVAKLTRCKFPGEDLVSSRPFISAAKAWRANTFILFGGLLQIVKTRIFAVPLTVTMWGSLTVMNIFTCTFIRLCGVFVGVADLKSQHLHFLCHFWTTPCTSKLRVA